MTARLYSAKVGERPETPALVCVEGDARKPIRVPTDDRKVEMRHFDEDVQFANENAREIRRLHPDQWVAVYDKQVVGADEDFRLLMKDLKALGYPPGKIAHQAHGNQPHGIAGLEVGRCWQRNNLGCRMTG